MWWRRSALLSIVGPLPDRWRLKLSVFFAAKGVKSCHNRGIPA